MAQALVAAPEAKELTMTESLPAPVLMEELLSMPTASALPPPRHQPPLLLALALMLMTSLPDPVWMLVLLMPVVLLLPLFHHQPPLLLEEALISMRVPKSLVAMKEVLLIAVVDPWLPEEWLWILTYWPVKVTDELLIAVAELEPLQLHEFEETLSLSLVTERR